MTTMSKENQFKGMILTLKKRMTYWHNQESENYQFTMFGHYDSMSIYNVDNWYELRPRGVYENGGVVNIEDEFLDKYSLKMYFPAQNCCAELESMRFAYKSWELIGRKSKGTEEIEKYEDLLRKNPFVSIAVIQLSKDNSNVEQNLIKVIGEKIATYVNSSGFSMEDIHCAIFPTIGYADFVILFSDKTPERSLQIMDYLRKEKNIDEDLLSSSYIITGFAREGLKNLAEINLKNIELSVRVNLRKGISADKFKAYFDEQLEKYWKKKVKDKPGIYQMFGNSDCLLLSSMPFDFFIPLYFDKNLLNPAHNLFKIYIWSIRSSLRVKVESGSKCNGKQDEKTVSQERNVLIDNYRNLFVDIVKNLEILIKDYNMATRIVCGLEGVMKKYLNMIQSGHCLEVEEIIGQAFSVLDCNIKRGIEELSTLSEYRQREAIEDLITAITFFREQIGNYLADLQRSDRSFIEGQSLSHPSVGSATKLLLFYNTYINNMARELVQIENKPNRKYVFVVISGGCDETNAWDLFAHFDPSVENNESLILLSIPEMSLYDIKGTLFRLLHECMHFCGERYRIERANAIIDAIARFLSNNLGDFIEPIIINFLKNDVFPEINSKLSSDEIIKICENVNLIVDQGKKKFIELQNKRIRKLFLEEIKNDTEESAYYRRNLKPRIMTIGKEKIFKPIVGDDQVLLTYTYQTFLEIQQEIIEQLIFDLKGHDIIYSNANLFSEINRYMQEMLLDKYYQSEDITFFKSYFEVLLGNEVWEDNIDIKACEQTILENVVVNIMDVFKECYADCMAARLLGISMEDFILSSVYETSNISIAFPDTTLEVLRLGLNLKVLYGVKENLSEEDIQRLDQKINYWKERGFNYARGQVTAEKLVERINKILSYYFHEITMNFMEPIEDYIIQCIKGIEEYNFENKNYGKLSDMETAEELHTLLFQINKFW